jgi:vacuolar-type H+-ATPase subunit I/STV1
MPKKEVDYSKTIIYKIVCNDLTITDIYVGQTTNFINRKSHHKKAVNNENLKIYNLNIYKKIRDNGNWENWSMVQIEQYPCTNSNEARTRERYWYEQLNANLNTICPFRENKKEYYEENKEAIRDKSKEYRNNNKDKIKEYKENHKDINKEQWKSYYKKNKDIIKQKQKEYNDKNRDERNRKKREKRLLNKSLTIEELSDPKK